MPSPRIRIPASFLIMPALFCGVFAVISGGVAVTQGPNAVWWPFGACLAGLALCGIARLILPVDWIGDEELERIERRAEYEEINRELLDGSYEVASRLRRYFLTGAFFALVAFRLGLQTDVVDSSGSRDGMTVAGFTLGVWHVFGRDWTGFDLILFSSLVGLLLWRLRGGVVTLLRAQKKMGPRD